VQLVVRHAVRQEVAVSGVWALCIPFV